MFAKLRKQWGVQAIWDAWAVRGIVGGMDYLVPQTLMPVLRLVSGDPAGSDSAYAQVIAQRERVGRLDSPRERWRKGYSHFVRELEWVSLQLKQHLSEEEYQALVSGAVARAIEHWAGALKPKFAQLFLEKPGVPQRHRSARTKTLKENITKFVSDNMFRHFNAVSFMVGPMQIRELDLEKGYMEAYIHECAMHTVVGTGNPQTEACVVSCKGGTELAFGKESPMRIELEPHLPGLACTMRAHWDVAALRAGRLPAAGAFVPEAQLLKRNSKARALSPGN